MRYILFLLALTASAQTVINGGRTFLGPVDASGATTAIPWPNLASAPATCSVGMKYHNTTDYKDYGCTATNTWTAMGSGSGSATAVYSGALNFGSIPDLGCAELTFTATGITTGAYIAPAWPVGLETGLIATARASAADTVAVRVCNVSGAAVDPANATYTVRDVAALGYLAGSGTINFGSIPDGGCLASTLTISGVTTGDKLAAGWPSALEAGLIGSMFASATDTVAVRLCNFSGAAVDPASATFRAAITK